MTELRLIPLLLVALLTGACSNSDPVEDDGNGVPTRTLDRATLCAAASTGDGQISGSVSFSSNPVLPQQHDLLYVELQDVSLQDASSVRIAGLCIDEPDHQPLNYRLNFDQSLIDERMEYSVASSLYRSDDGLNYRLGYTDDTIRPVLTRGFGQEAYPVLIPVNP